MVRLIRVFILVLDVLIIYQCAPEEIILQGSIKGTVTDANNRDPVPEVLINLDYINATVDSDTTGLDGSYTIKHITPGVYDISASKSGFTKFSEHVKIESASTYQEDIMISQLPYPKFSDQYLDFGSDSITKFFTISNVGSGNLRYTLSASQNWISVFPESGEITTETDSIRVSIERDGLSANKHIEMVSIVSYLDNEIKLDTMGILINGVADREGNYYGIVALGTQTWMAENLNTGKKIGNTTTFPKDDGIHEKYCYYNDEEYCTIYGGLYNWDEMMDYHPSDTGAIGTTQGVCPDGWHIPTVPEWTALAEYLGGFSVAGAKMKAVSPYWIQPNTGATDESGFSALPGGVIYKGVFVYLGVNAYFWTSQIDQSGVWYFRLQYDNVRLFDGQATLSMGDAMSVRCVRDPL